MSEDRIVAVKARRVWDSRARPTVEAEVTLAGGALGRGIAPAGASTGTGEALDRRDHGDRHQGFDVQGALTSLRGEISAAMLGLPASDQERVDQTLIALDGTKQKSRLGGNATIAVSLAVLHAAANAAKMPLWHYLSNGMAPVMPLPEIQIFGGGMHADQRIALQDVMVVCPAASSFAEALEWTAEIYHAAGALMKQKGVLHGVADEGGFWPDFQCNEAMLEAAVAAIVAAGFEPGKQVGLSLDVAASSFGRSGQYRPSSGLPVFGSNEWIGVVEGWLRNFPIFAIEDPLAEDDPVAFARFTERNGSARHVIGDDLLVTDEGRIADAARARLINAALIKPNQAGTITETKRAFDTARRAGLAAIVSARSGESEDVSVTHLAIGWGAEMLKVGSIARGERTAKWNEALRIEEQLGPQARFAGWEGLRCKKA
jgi:enolase